MTYDITTTPLWLKAAVSYLLVGFCTQLPGVLYGHFLMMRRFQILQRSSVMTKTLAGLGWLIYTTLLWPTPFLRAGINLIALQLMLLGVISSLVLVNFGSSLGKALGIVVIAGILAMVLARPRGL